MMSIFNGLNSITNFIDILKYLFQVRTFSDFSAWFDWIDTPYKIGFCIIVFGFVYLFYLFFAAMIFDNDE